MSGPQASFDLVRIAIDGNPVLVVYGDLDMVTAPKLHEALTEILKEAQKVVLVDMANVTFIDSSALAALLVADRHMHEKGGELRLVAVPDTTTRVFEAAGLADRFHIYSDTQSATDSVSEKDPS